MDKIEAYQIMPYLPYKLKAMCEYNNKIGIISGASAFDEYADIKLSIDGLDSEHIWMFKPILRQFTLNDVYDYFSDRFETDIDSRTFISEEFLSEFSITFDEIFEYKTEWLPVGLYNLLIKHHFDIFGLIEKGLAVDISTLNQKIK